LDGGTVTFAVMINLLILRWLLFRPSFASVGALL